MRPEETTKCLQCKHLKDHGEPMLVCIPKWAWIKIIQELNNIPEEILKNMEWTDQFIDTVRKEIKYYDKARSKK